MQALTLVAQCQPGGQAAGGTGRGAGGAGGGRQRGFGARQLQRRSGVGRQLQRGAHALQAQRVLGVVVLHRAGAEHHLLAGLHAGRHTTHPAGQAALLHFVGNAQRVGVEGRVQAGQGGLEQDAPGQRLDLVVHKTGQRHAAQHQCGQVAVAGQQLDLFAVVHQRCAAQAVGPGRAQRGQFVHHRAAAGLAGKRAQAVAAIITFELAFDAVQAAAVLAQAALLQHACGDTAGEAAVGNDGRLGLGAEITQQQPRAATVQPQIQPAGGLGVKTGHRFVAVDRVELTRLDVAEQALAAGLVAVVGQGQQRITQHLAFEEQRGARTTRTVGGVVQRLLKAVLCACRLHGAAVQATQVEHRVHQAGGNQRAQLGHHVELGLRPHIAGRRLHQHIPRLAGCLQRHQQLATGHKHLQAGFVSVQVGLQPAASCAVQGDRGG